MALGEALRRLRLMVVVVVVPAQDLELDLQIALLLGNVLQILHGENTWTKIY